MTERGDKAEKSMPTNATETRDWHAIMLDVLKGHEVRLGTYVPDNVLRPLIDGAHADPYRRGEARRDDRARSGADGTAVGHERSDRAPMARER